MPFGYGLWVWFRNNPAAQVAAAVVAGIVVFFGWLGLHDRKVRRESRLKAEIKTRKVADKIITKMETESDERIEKANEAADAVAGDVTSDSLRDDTAGFLFGDAGRD
jgi:hypothetical protein